MLGCNAMAIVVPAARQLLKATAWNPVSVVEVNDLPWKNPQSPIILELSMTVLADTFTWLPALPSKRECEIVIEPLPL
jgi:hypothetical protein